MNQVFKRGRISKDKSLRDAKKKKVEDLAISMAEISINKDSPFFLCSKVEGVGPALSRDPITLDLRQYNPLTAHLLTQSYVYPKSNGLTQTDRGNFSTLPQFLKTKGR